MATPIRIKRSAVSGKRPQLTDLQVGELALNTYDGSLFTERDTGGVGIATTVSNLTPWTESYGASSISYLNSVGIGTANPAGKLHISSGTSGDCELIIEADTDNNNEADNPRIIFRQDGGANHSSIGHENNRLVISNSVSNGSIVFKTGISTPYTNAVERLRINSSGNVGINSTAPTSKLDVDGDVKVSGVSTFTGNIDANGIIEGIAGENKIPSLYANLAALPDANTYHGMFAHVHSTGRGYFAHAGNWLELVNKDTSGNVALSNDLNVEGNVSIAGTLTYEDVTNIDSVGLITARSGIHVVGGGVSIAADGLNVSGISTFEDNVKIRGTGNLQIEGSGPQVIRLLDDTGAEGIQIAYRTTPDEFTIENQADASKFFLADRDNGQVELYNSDVKRLETTGVGITVFGNTETQTLNVTGVSTFTGKIIANSSIGIGIDNPNQKLDIRDSDPRIQLVDTDNNENIQLRNNQGNFILSATKTSFFTGGSQKVVITSGGDVGIGTNIPATNLHISDVSGAGQNSLRVDTSGSAITINNHTESMGFIGNDSGALFINAGGTEDTLLLQTGGTERLRITGIGSVGINSTAPQTKLDVIDNPIGRTWTPLSSSVAMFERNGGSLITLASGTSGVVGIDFADSTDNNRGFIHYNHSDDSMFFRTNAAEQLRIKSDGNIGIGTDNPSQKLDVRGDIIAYESSSGSVRLVQDGNIEITNNNGGIIDFKTADNEDFDCRIRQMSNGLQFMTGGNGSTDEAVRITSDGKVGIGSQIPQTKLDIYDNSAGLGGIIQVTQEGTGDAAIDFQLVGTREYSLGIDNSDSDKFKLSGSAGLANNTLLTVTSDGNVGIGTDNPTEKLHLAADSAFQILLKRSGANPSEAIFGNEGNTTRISNNKNGIDFRTGSTPSSSMFIDQNGKVGIGTDDPQVKLHIQDTKHQIRLSHIESGTSTTDAGVIFKTNDSQLGGVFTEVDGEILSYGINVSQLETSSGITTSRVGGIFRLDTRIGNFGDGSCFVVKGRSIGTTVEHNSVVINLDDGNTFLSPSKGKVGIGTDDLDRKLHVLDTTAVPLLLERTGSNNNTVIQYKNDISSIYAGLAGGGAKGWGVGTQSNAGSAAGNLFMITRVDGNVGIGTNDPQMKLVVSTDGNGIEFNPKVGGTNNHRILAYDRVANVRRGLEIDAQSFEYRKDLETRLKILSDGKVGIGTDNPQTTLEVVGAGVTIFNQAKNASIQLDTGRIELARTDSAAYIDFKTSPAEDFDCRIRQVSNGLVFSTGGNGSTDERLRIKSDGGTALTRTHLGGRRSTDTSQNYFKIGTWKGFTLGSRAKITIFGTATFNAGENVAGETVIYLALAADETMHGHFHSVSHTRPGVQKVIYKLGNSNTEAEIWIKYQQNYAMTKCMADVSLGTWEAADEDSGSTNVATGATDANIDSMYAIFTSDGTNSKERFRVSNDGSVTITDQGGSSNTPSLQVDNNISASFIHTMQALTPNIASGQQNIIILGRQRSVKNTAFLGYKYSGTPGSNNNLFTINHWGSEELLTVNGQGDTAIAGDLNVNGNVSIGGTLTYEDVTNIDSVGVITARNGIHVTGGSVGIGTNNPTGTNALAGNTATLAVGILTANTIYGNVVGGLSPTGDVFIGGNLDVDGQTDLDVLNVSDTATFTSNLIGYGNVGFGTVTNSEVRVKVAMAGTDKIIQQWGGYLGSTAGHRFMELYTPATDNSNDYFRFKTGNAFKFQVDSIDALCINSSGNIGIGTDNPTQKLEVKYGEAWIDNNSGDGAARSNGLTVSHAPGSNFTVGSDPSDDRRAASFIVKGSSRAAIVALRNVDDNSAFWDFIADGNTNKFYIQRGSAGAALGPAVTIDTSLNVGIGTNSPQTKLHLRQAIDNNSDGFRISRVNSAASYSQYIDTSARFNIGYSNPSTADPDPQITLNQNGYVGIGTNLPQALLDVSSDSPNIRIADLNSSAGAGNTSYTQLANINGNTYVYTRANENNGSYLIGGHGDGVFDEFIRINHSGKVGIGTNNPNAPLHVVQKTTDAYGTGVARFEYYDTDDNGGTGDQHYDVKFIPTGTYFKTFVTGAGTDFLIVDADNSADRASFAVEGNAGNIKSFKVMSNGNVGIGLTNPQTKLDVQRTTEGEVARFRASNNTRYLKISSFNAEYNGSGYDFDATSTGGALRFSVTSDEKLRITKGGNVGINSSVPQARLDVVARGDSAGGIFITDSNDAQAAPYLRVLGKRRDNNTGQNFSGRVLLASLRTDGDTASIGVGTGKRIGTIMFGGNHTDGSESNILYPASIAGVANDHFSSASSMPTDLVFYTGSIGRTATVSNVSSGEERLRILSGGEVFVGCSTSIVTNPKFAVNVGPNNLHGVTIHSDGSENDGDLSGMAFSHGDNSTSLPRPKAAIALRATGTYGRGHLCFYVDGANDNNPVSSADEKLRINLDGDLLPGGSSQDIGASGAPWDVGYFNTLNVTGNVSIGGTLTYEDVTNIDSVGIITARSGLIVNTGISTFHDAIEGVSIGATAGNLYLKSGKGYCITGDFGGKSEDSTYVEYSHPSVAVKGSHKGINGDIITFTFSEDNKDTRTFIFKYDDDWEDQQPTGTCSLNVITDYGDITSSSGGYFFSHTALAGSYSTDFYTNGHNYYNYSGSSFRIEVGTIVSIKSAVGIGTSVPTDTATDEKALLAVAGIVTAHEMYASKFYGSVEGGVIVTAGVSTFNDKVGIGNTIPNATLEVNGPIKTNAGTYQSPHPTGDSKSDVALVMPTDSGIYIEHQQAGIGTFLRRLIGEFGDGVIEIGQHSTGIIKEIRATAGSSGFFSVYSGTNQRLGVTTNGSVNIGGDYTQATNKLQVTGNAKIIDGDLTISKSGVDPTFTVETTEFSSRDALIKIRGARTTAPDSNIAMLQFDNKTNSPYTMAQISAMDAAGDHNEGKGKLVFRTASGGTLSDQMVIKEDGNVGIGTNNPSAKLHIGPVDGDSTPHLYLASANNDYGFRIDTDDFLGGNVPLRIFSRFNGNDTERIRVKQSGEVGIGTNNPLVALHVKSGAGAGYTATFNARTAAVIDGDNSAGTTLSIISKSSGFSGLFFGRPNSEARGQIQYIHSSDAFRIVTNAGGMDALRIKSNNNVGINTDDPSYALEVSAESFVKSVFKGTGSNVNNVPLFINSGDSASHISNSSGSSGETILLNKANNSIIFETNDTERLRITSAGSVNIGGDYTQSTYKMKVTGSFAATTKSFVIDHPTKEGMKLRHGSLEGPENGVYVRGRLKDNNTIELPDYWTGLVDEDTITVNLTPIGNKSTLHKVVDIYDNTVVVGSEDGNINCFYTVFGERKDVEKMEVEY